MNLRSAGIYIMKLLKKFFLPVAAVIAVYFLVKPVNNLIKQAYFLLSLYDSDTIKGFIESFGSGAPLASFLLMIFQSVVVPLPAFPIVFSNMALYGKFYGLILSFIGTMAGATLCFLISKLFTGKLTDGVTRRITQYKTGSAIDKYCKYILLITRLVPVIHFDIISYAAGITSISFRAYILATCLGFLPLIIIYLTTGNMFTVESNVLITGISLLPVFTAPAYLLIISLNGNQKEKYKMGKVER